MTAHSVSSDRNGIFGKKKSKSFISCNSLDGRLRRGLLDSCKGSDVYVMAMYVILSSLVGRSTHHQAEYHVCMFLYVVVRTRITI